MARLLLCVPGFILAGNGQYLGAFAWVIGVNVFASMAKS